MTFTDYLKDIATEGLRRSFAHVEEDLIDVAQGMTRRASRYIMKELLALMLIVGSVIFFCAAGAFFMIEYLALSKTIAFLMVGIVLLLGGVISKLR